VAQLPLLGAFARWGGTVFLDRSRPRDAARAADEVARRLGHRLVVTAFPEGRAGRGEELRPFRSPLLEAAVRTGTPCVPASLRYALPCHPGLDPGEVVAWADAQGFVGHATRLLGLRGVEVQLRFGAPRRGDDRKLLARELEHDVRALLGSSSLSK
jgi:1-acyl-sn-glycerol-3-phosphate acyltransferase